MTAKVGRGSKPGERRGGRKKGTPNKTTATVRAALSSVYESRGGDTALETWANEQPTEFYRLWGRMMPTEIDASVSGGLTIRVVRE